MKFKNSISITAFLFAVTFSYAQNLNWANLTQDQKHIINLYVGMDHSISYGVGYGYQVKTIFPIVVSIDYSQPSGNKLIDDFKAKVGGQVQLYRTGPLYATLKVYGIFRRYENDYVRMLNWGSDLSAVVGYYKPKWFAATEVGFDKAIISNFKHSKLFKTHFPEVQDGWYEPAMGGNFYYGLQGGASFGRTDVSLKLGKVISQDFKTEPALPFYVQLGVSHKFGN